MREVPLLQRWDERNQRIAEYQLRNPPRDQASWKSMLLTWVATELAFILLRVFLPVVVAISVMGAAALVCVVWVAVRSHRRRRDWENQRLSLQPRPVDQDDIKRP